MEPTDISTIVLTYNEELHIRRCLENAKRYAAHVFVVDSFSTDRTVEIARSLGAQVVQHEFINYSKQFNWALQNLPIATEWVWRQDADEILSDELIEELPKCLASAQPTVAGYTAMRIMVFLGKVMKHGMLSMTMLRLFRRNGAHCEARFMDEHMVVDGGRVEALSGSFFDDNLNGLTWWTQKHNGYATREAVDLLLTEYGLIEEGEGNIGEHSRAVRKNKLRYVKLPLFWRAAAFFGYRYFLKLGFLDGKEGFLWHFLQGWWYRTLADAKVYEIKKRFDFDGERVKDYLKETYLKP